MSALRLFEGYNTATEAAEARVQARYAARSRALRQAWVLLVRAERRSSHGNDTGARADKAAALRILQAAKVAKP